MFYKHDSNGVIIYKSTLLCGVPHGFSTRVGGVSVLSALASMNMGFGKADGVDAVCENRRRFAAAVGVDAVSSDVFVSAKEQVHGDTVEYITESGADIEYVCDGFYTNKIGVPVAVKTADCVPILLAAEDGSAVAAVHAGWRGTALGIAAVGVMKLRSLGVDPDKIRVAIGPSISPERYQVSDDFSEMLCANMCRSQVEEVRQHASALSTDYVKKYSDGMHCDLWSLNEAILTLVGVRAENIDTAGICTYDGEEYFYSHRRMGNERGVMAAMIAATRTASQ